MTFSISNSHCLQPLGENKNENHELLLEGLKFNRFTRGFSENPQCTNGSVARDYLLAKLYLRIPSPFFHHLSLDITNNLPNLTHLTIYSINSYNFSIISATKSEIQYPMSSKQSSRLVTRRSMAVNATSHPLRPSKTVKEAAFSGSSACAKDNRGAPLVSRHCSLQNTCLTKAQHGGFLKKQIKWRMWISENCFCKSERWII